MSRFIITLALLASGFALAAQTGITWDPSAWAADIAVMAAAIVGFTSFIRKHLWESLDGILVSAVAVLLGAALGAGLHFMNYFPTLIEGIVHGTAAGFASFLGVDAVRGVLRLGKG